MGYSPEQVNAMSVFQWNSCVEGWEKANSTDESLSNREIDELWEWLQSKESP